jgi:hypothetical protein
MPAGLISLTDSTSMCAFHTSQQPAGWFTRAHTTRELPRSLGSLGAQRGAGCPFSGKASNQESPRSTSSVRCSYHGGQKSKCLADQWGFGLFQLAGITLLSAWGARLVCNRCWPVPVASISNPECPGALKRPMDSLSLSFWFTAERTTQ